jgi:hypothetical protein
MARYEVGTSYKNNRMENEMQVKNYKNMGGKRCKSGRKNKI